MHLMFTLDPVTGRRVYTLKKIANGEVTKSAHPARFSPDDKFSRHRVTLKKRYKMLPTQIADQASSTRALGDPATKKAATTKQEDADRIKVLEMAKAHEQKREVERKKEMKASWAKK